MILGMDTGGTYTDAVLLDQCTKRVIKKAKAPTTKEDLCIGIRACIDALNYENSDEINLVCLSTTLATNSIVEGKGCKVGLVITGKSVFGELPDAQIVNVGGSLDIKGRLLRELDEDYVRRMVLTLKGKVDAVAVSGYACVRNPEHELIVRQIVRQELNVPVVCAHELTCDLGYYERTVTAVLNARLIPLIKRLIDDTSICLKEKGIKAPIMMVRGDGSYMDSEYAIERPVETILSGPAASIKGALHLGNIEDGTVIDVGGTTSDIAMLRNGKVGISMEGAKVGGWKTRVRAIDVFTCGVGGDSKIDIAEDGHIKIGPNKITPVSYAKSNNIKKMINIDSASMEHEYRNIFGLSEEQNEIGLTPTDVAHIIGIYSAWDKEAAVEYLEKNANKLNVSKEKLLNDVVEAFKSSVLDALENSQKTQEGIPIVALGAPSEAWMPIILKDSKYDLVIPPHSEVANAVGAAIGEIEVTVKVLIRRDELSGRYVGYSRWFRKEYDTLEKAKDECLEEAVLYAIDEGKRCGCDNPQIFKNVHDEYCDSFDGKRHDWIETVIDIVSAGMPRFLV